MVYEDTVLAAVVKPRKLPVQRHPTRASLEAGLPYVLRRVRGVKGALPFPQHVHRLDLPAGALHSSSVVRALCRTRDALCIGETAGPDPNLSLPCTLQPIPQAGWYW